MGSNGNLKNKANFPLVSSFTLHCCQPFFHDFSHLTLIYLKDNAQLHFNVFINKHCFFSSKKDKDDNIYNSEAQDLSQSQILQVVEWHRFEYLEHKNY